MTTEKSHGKARTVLPRSSDLTTDPPGTERDPSEGRDDKGRAAPGNQLALGRGWKSAIRRSLVRAGASDDVARGVIATTMTVYQAILRDFPVSASGPLVRMNAAGAAREFALAQFFDDRALACGLMTEAGIALAARASHHRQRSERMTVTTRDLARASAPRKATRTAAASIRAEIGKDDDDAE